MIRWYSEVRGEEEEGLKGIALGTKHLLRPRLASYFFIPIS